MREFTDYPLRLRHIPEERSSHTGHLFTAALYSVEFNIYLQDLNPKVAADCQSYLHIRWPSLHLNRAAFCLSFMLSVVIRLTKQHIYPNIKPLNTELNPIYHLLALLEAHHILHVSRIRVNLLFIYKAYFSLKYRSLSGDIIKI